ncbi:NAD(P)-binding protein [Sparassis latifolia]
MLSVVEIFAVIGVLLSISIVYRFALFVWLYFLRPSGVHKFLHGPPAYAIVTGATDGIGRAVAQELYNKGFNLILHGRNEEKMRGVVESIRATGLRDVRYFIADASQQGVDFVSIAERYKDLNTTLVIHNVGGSSPRRCRIDGFTESELLGIVQMNALFPLLLTRALLPSLRASAAHGPVLVQFVGSQGADVSPPRFALYASSKRFLQALARGLDVDERVWDGASGVRFEYAAVGEVRSQTHPVQIRVSSPSAERFARSLVKRVGCGWRRYAPYMPHAYMQWIVELLGETVVEKYVVKEIDQILALGEKKA